MVNQQRPVPKSKTITANPLFPAVVALWFGALFGLSSLAVRVSVIESLVVASGIDLVVPAAAPPLGITARLLVALILAAFGALIGATIARRLARPTSDVRERQHHDDGSDAAEQQVRSRDSHPDAPARRPISAHEELGEAGAVDAAATPGPLAGRRRALTVATEPTDIGPHDAAPLQRGEPQILDLAGAEMDRSAALVHVLPIANVVEAIPAPADIDLNAYADEPAVVAEPLPPVAAPPVSQIFSTASAPHERADETTAEDHGGGLSGRQVFGMTPVEPQDPASRQIFGGGVPIGEPAAAPPQLAGHREPDQVVSAADPAPADPLPPVGDLDMIGLALRLQESMQRRRAARAALSGAPTADTAPAAEPAPLYSRLPSDVLTTDVAPDLPAAPTAAPVPLARPAAMRPLSLDDFSDDDDEGDDALATIVPPRHITLAPAAIPVANGVPDSVHHAAAPVTGDDDTDDGSIVDDSAFASLLGVKAPAVRPTSVRSDLPGMEGDQVEPVVIFPGQFPGTMSDVAPVVSPNPDERNAFRRFDAPASAGHGQPIAGGTAVPTLDAAEAERSLRSALANLQRISGAA